MLLSVEYYVWKATYILVNEHIRAPIYRYVWKKIYGERHIFQATESHYQTMEPLNRAEGKATEEHKV